VPYETFDQLEIRTKDFIFLDWNPANEFWFYSDILGKRDDVDHLTLTYKDNEALDPEIVKSIEQHQTNRTWWRVYGEGKLGEIEGKIYKDWQIIDDIPHEARLLSYGLDFGYTNDPSAIVSLSYLNGGYIFNEIAFQKGLSNKQLADIILALPPAPTIADAAEPKSIDEMRLYGLTMIGSTKGKGSVLQRIQFLQAQRVSVTKSSVNVIKEYRNYIWRTDAQGKVINEPEHQWSHSMDACSYAMQIKSSVTPVKVYQQPAYESPGLDESPKSIMETLEQGDFRPQRAV
jgi:phage terminase large subunit